MSNAGYSSGTKFNGDEQPINWYTVAGKSQLKKKKKKLSLKPSQDKGHGIFFIKFCHKIISCQQGKQYYLGKQRTLIYIQVFIHKNLRQRPGTQEQLLKKLHQRLASYPRLGVQTPNYRQGGFIYVNKVTLFSGKNTYDKGAPYT